jgi:5-carboxymethyl-2-hydroxymuconate isomerase
MPHLVILYTGQLDTETNMKVLCRDLADAMLTVVDEAGKQVFPTGGTRVLAYPAPHYAVADGGTAGRQAAQFDSNPHGGSEDYAFVYLNVRMGKGLNSALVSCWLRSLKNTLRTSLPDGILASLCKLMWGLKCLTTNTATSIPCLRPFERNACLIPNALQNWLPNCSKRNPRASR